MKDINAAYDQIQKDRKAGRTSYQSQSYGGGYNSGSYNGGYYNAGGYNQGYNQSYSGSSQFSDIRRLIQQNRIAEADELDRKSVV